MNLPKNNDRSAREAPGALLAAAESSAGAPIPGSTADFIPAAAQGLATTVAFVADGNTPTKSLGPKPSKAPGWPMIPGYEIIRELGRGGMGVVYQAKQQGLNRLVAIKTLLAADAELLARFKIEAQAVAKLKHPNIVQIYEIGEQNGYPFFSMEFANGGSLERRIDRTPQPALDAAVLMETIARAVQVAHYYEIVHRDLKPGNILLTFADHPSASATHVDPSREWPVADGPLRTAIPKISDFGLAKQLETASELTRSGTIMGTPRYMAPEQARGEVNEVGPLSDVYGLGAILYELLTGRPPFVTASMVDTLQQVIHAEPVPPRRLEPKVPRDLETICLKCLQKDPRKRYASAEALADDLHRFVAGEPILGRPVSSTERIWRWSRRNPKLAVATGTSILLLLTVTGVSSWFAVTLAHKNKLIDQEKQIAVEAEKKATLSAKAATQQATQNLQTIQMVIEEINKQLSNVPRTQRVRENILKLAADRLKQVSGAVDKSTSKEATDLASLHALGNLYVQIGESDKAFDYLSRALELARARVEFKNHSDSSRMNLANVLLDLGRVCQELRRDMQLALEYYEEALRVRQEILDDPRAGDGNAANPLLVKKLLGEDQVRVATTIFRLGNPAGALPYYQASFSVRSELVKRTANPGIHQDLLRSRLGVAEMRFRLEDATTVRQEYMDAIAEREKLLADHSDNRAEFTHELARTYCSFGDVCLFIGDLAAAKTNYEQCRDRMQMLADMDDQTVSYQRELGLAWYRLGGHALRSKDLEAAVKYFADCLTIRQSLADKDPANDRRQMELMLALAHCGEHVRAAALAEKYRASNSPDNEMLIDVARCLAQCSAAVNSNPALQKVYADNAIATLAVAVVNGYRDVVYLRCEPDLDPLRELAEFKAIFDKIRPGSLQRSNRPAVVIPNVRASSSPRELE